MVEWLAWTRGGCGKAWGLRQTAKVRFNLEASSQAYICARIDGRLG